LAQGQSYCFCRNCDSQYFASDCKMVRRALICSLHFVSSLALNLRSQKHSNLVEVETLFPEHIATQVGKEKLDKAFELAYKLFNNSFDFKTMKQFEKDFEVSFSHYRESDAFNAYQYYPDRPHCDKGVASGAHQVSGVAAYPGGITQRTLGSDLSQKLSQLSEEANGPASAGLVLPKALATQAVSMGKSLIQAVLAAIIHTVPPLIPPPVWNNMPLPCAPMVTGHNCFGAVLYPITMADFVTADVTDSMLDGVIAGFPNTYASKVGKTSDKMYKLCFSSYMSMHCSSIFPRCSTPQARDEPMPIGRLPMCLHLCVLPLVACPGFWIGDVIGQCSMVSVPPMCTQAFFWNMWKLPPQYSDFDEANPFPKKCPVVDSNDAAANVALYDVMTPSSPILKEASSMKGPVAESS